MSPEQNYGLDGERWVFNQLVRLGYKPTVPPYFNSTAYDFKIGNVCVEVKTARQTVRRQKLKSGKLANYPRWQWSFEATTLQLNSDWVAILVAEIGSQRVPYIVPGAIIGDRTHLQVTRHPDHFRGWLSLWRDQWQVITYLLQRSYVDKPNFHQWQKTVN